MTASAVIRVVVAEDSAVQRAKLVQVLQADGDISVVGEASDAAQAVAMTAALRPDVVTMDLHMPGNGQHAIEQIMGQTPTPILVLSVLVSSAERAPAVEALVAGALDAIPKPARWTDEAGADVRRRVRTLRGVTVIRHRRRGLPLRSAPSATAARSASPYVVVIAASTGGPPALAHVLGGLAGVRAPILVVQHIHRDFVDGLATWMRRVAPLEVRVATSGELARAGVVYIAPGDVHLRIGAGLRIALSPEPPTTHRPSADELFTSAAEHAGRSAIGVVLTGMGDDGAKGLLAIRNRGGFTIAQDEETSAVFGMPRAAQLAGAAVRVMPLDGIARVVVDATHGRRT